MTFIERVKSMFGLHSSLKSAPVADVGRAIQRNDIAQEKAREALEDFKRSNMTDTVKVIARKMK